jgi:putative transposase
MDQLAYSRQRFPPPIIQHSLWLYLRFTSSYRDVEDLLASAGSMCPTKQCGPGC